MELALTVARVVAPVLILAGIGYGWRRAGYDYPTEFVTRLVMTLAVPCLIFTALMQTQIAPAALTALSLAAVSAYGLVIVAMWALIAVFRLDRASLLAPLVFGNTGNIGLPLALFAFGETGLGLAVVVFAVMALLTFTVGLWMVAGTANPTRVLREPILYGTILGALFLWQGWQTPVWLTNTLDLIGQLAVPLMLITLGVAVARLRPGRIAQALWLSAVKFVACLAAALAAGWYFTLDPVALAVLIVQMVTPVAVTSYLLAERYEVDADAVAGLVVVSTLMAVVTLPITLSFLL
ncbi:Auxin efflux carrier family protein [Roseibacterium elongatum DSM 19469]|uniref:Auxin efflux carrier family protein n=1 Tax=Roseicyclus elongatus DSM 19469 TaxID=1294273 RepID=W8S3A6_9RHOB|nr:AEC family transporter [Roseibacterium elongatum]AHM03246.1 Auxin efflux carrier family protein [Roseibacterium elongatum DSM 19469]